MPVSEGLILPICEETVLEPVSELLRLRSQVDDHHRHINKMRREIDKLYIALRKSGVAVENV